MSDDLKTTFIPVSNLPYETKDIYNPACEMKTEAEGIIMGYASTFHKKPDLQGDIVEPGAFLETIENRGVNGNGIKFLWQHVTSRPIGVPLEIKEDTRGLYTKSQAAIKTDDGHDAFVFAEMGALDGFSIGYKVDEYEYDDKTGITRFKKLGLYEYSLVTFAANPRANITGVKTAIKTAKTPRQLEQALRELGLSRSAATYITSLCKNSLQLAKGEGNLQDLLKSLKSMNADLLITRMINKCEIKKVIPFKSYPLADEGADWDASAEIKKSEVSDLKIMCTWYDSENAKTKSAYKLPHHMKSGYKTVWRGVTAAMGALLGARGGVQIPAGDRKAIYNHLAKHYKEFDKEPPKM